MKLRDGIKYAVCGALAGVANGFFGAGGGMVLIPLFTRWIKMDDKKAFATSLAVILPLCAVSAVIYLIKGSVDLSTELPYVIG
ncbi:MAG: TSUP family transporter, partial [Oscillospiraceae bacterium]|nr:TSUP family transporter [Oscillospiraceae bacterium]